MMKSSELQPNVSLPTLPKDGQLIALIMKSMGIHECEPQTIPQLLEFMYRHCTETLQDAHDIANHVNHKRITLDDLRFAIQSRATRSFVLPPSREVLLDISIRKNAEPLPLVSNDPVNILHLPPDEYCLLGQQSFPISLPTVKSTSK